MNPELMLHIKKSIYLVLTNLLSTSFLLFHITFDEISKTLSIQFWYKGRYTQHLIVHALEAHFC